MLALYICIGILLFFTALMLIRVGCRVVYGESGLLLYLKVAGFQYLLMPRPPMTEEEKASKEKKKQAKAARKAAKKKAKQDADSTAKPDAEPKKKGNLTLLLQLIKPALQALNRLRIKINITHLKVDYAIAGADDPAKAAVRYGIVSAGGGALFPLINESFHVSDWDVNIGVDFDKQETCVALDGTATLFLGQLLVIAVIFAYQAYLIYDKNAKNTKGGC